MSADDKLFQEDGKALPFEEAVTSGLSVGTPGTPATWETALDQWGTKSLGKVLQPAERLARDGFTVDETFRQQTADNEERFRDFPATAELFLPGGKLPEVGSTMRNPDLARTYKAMADKGADALYHGPAGRRHRQHRSQAAGGPGLRAQGPQPGDLTAKDLRAYEVKKQAPTKHRLPRSGRYGMAPSSSGGTTVGEALNILERGDLCKLSEKELLHRYIEASRDRLRGPRALGRRPGRRGRTDEGAALAAVRRLPRLPDQGRRGAQEPARARRSARPRGLRAPVTRPRRRRTRGENTTHLTAADKWGNVVAYTLTIEQTGGSGITVPGRGFLLNNELTDFSFAPADPAVHDPNLPGPGKRPRSSMSPTIVLDDGKPVFALGSPGRRDDHHDRAADR